MTLRRYAPMKQSAGTRIPDRIRDEVVERDGRCVGAVVGMPQECGGSYGLDHVRASGGIGMKSRTEPDNLVYICSVHHRVKTENGRTWRPVLLDYLMGLYLRPLNPHAAHVDPCGPLCRGGTR